MRCAFDTMSFSFCFNPCAETGLKGFLMSLCLAYGGKVNAIVEDYLLQ